MQGENQDRWKLSEYLHRPIPIEGRDVIWQQKVSELQKHETHMHSRKEERKEMAWRERKKKKKPRKQNCSNHTGKKNDHVRNRESQNEQLRKEFVREGLGHHTRKDKQHRGSVLPMPFHTQMLDPLIWILCWRTGRGLGVSPHFKSC